VSSPKRCKKKTTLSPRNCESKRWSTVALRKSVRNCSRTQISSAFASNILDASTPLVIVYLRLPTFCEIFFIFIITPNLDFSGTCTTSKHWQDIGRAERKSVTGLIENRIKINLNTISQTRESNVTRDVYRICFPPLNIIPS
jgi:hypothetical protein